MPTKPDPATSERMRRIRRRDTSAERAVRRALHGRGLRYRVDAQIDGVNRARPDIVFTRAKVAVYVDGCFWHGCPEHSTVPTANREWWQVKLAANVERDRRHVQELEVAGWFVVRVWEHEDADLAADRIEAAVLARRERPEVGSHGTRLK